MSYPICRSEIDDNIKTIVVRPVVIILDKAKNKISVFVREDNVHSIKEAQSIAEAFSSNKREQPATKETETPTDKLIMQRKVLLQKYQTNGISELL